MKNLFKILKDYINRNSPIFIIGAITIVVFLFVIFISGNKDDKVQNTNLVVIDEVQNKKIDQENEIKKAKVNKILDEKYGVVKFTYTFDGFDPMNKSIILNQLIQIYNDTDSLLKINQLIDAYPEFREGITIQPKQTFEFRPSKLRLWTIEDDLTKKRLYITVLPLRETTE